MKPGRNDPCPCGSGRKYKHCCLAAEATSVRTGDIEWRRIRRANEGLISKMLSFAAAAYGESGIHEAWAEFMTLDEDESLDWEQSPYFGTFLPWMLHFWSPDPHGTGVADESLIDVPPTRAYLDRKGRSLDPTSRRYLEACLDAQFSFHEITDCEPGRGFRTVDLITGAAHDVLEASGSERTQKGDILFASLVRCDGIVLLEGCGPTPLPPIRKLPILELRNKIGAGTDLFATDALHEWDIELRWLYLDIAERILNPTLPEMCNTDGDPLSLQQLIFDIDSPQAAFDALKHLALDMDDAELLAGAEYASDGGSLRKVAFQWLKAGNRVHESWSNTALGTIEIEGERLSAHVNSDKRAAKFRRIVVKALGNRARYRVTELQSIEHALAEERGGEVAAAEQSELMNLPEIKAQLASMMWQHYEGWVTQKIPALGGKTPLQAVKNPASRETVDALIAQIERDGRVMNPPLDESIPRRLRERLGLSVT